MSKLAQKIIDEIERQATSENCTVRMYFDSTAALGYALTGTPHGDYLDYRLEQDNTGGVWITVKVADTEHAVISPTLAEAKEAIGSHYVGILQLARKKLAEIGMDGHTTKANLTKLMEV